MSWSRDFETVYSGSLLDGDSKWFVEGQLNASYNCIDRHAFKDPNRVAIIYEADEAEDGRNVTYGELLRQVSKTAWTLKQMGVRKGDTVAIYLPMIPEAIVAILACVRIGAVHSVVFAGFSADSLRDRVMDARSKVVITTDEGKRGGKLIGTKKIVDDALKQCDCVTHVLVYKRTGAHVPMQPGRDLWWHEEVEKWPSYIAPEIVNAEDPMFLLYTSGSTGKPKGVLHTTAGYLLGCAMSGKYVFDIHEGDRYFCGGDVGWITGHSYVVYAPLLLGVSTVVFEGTPAYPNFSRYWDIIDKHKITQFYVAPTALRLLKRAGDEHVRGEMKHLRVLGSVGEPIAAEVWKWYFEVVGREEAHIVDVSREAGCQVDGRTAGLCADLMSCTDLLADGDGLPRHHPPGRNHPDQARIRVATLLRHRARHHRPSLGRGDTRKRRRWRSRLQASMAQHGPHRVRRAQAIHGHVSQCIQGLLRTQRPSCAGRCSNVRVAADSHVSQFTGDGAGRDHEGFYWIRGRVDDVVNVSGHRLSTAEIEAALIEHHAVAEAAVVGVADELTGQAVNAFVAVKDGNVVDDALRKEFITQVRKSIGPFAAPKAIYIVPDLPKTRSGKIMRRILRKILAGEEDQLGDTTTVSSRCRDCMRRQSIWLTLERSCRIRPLWIRSSRRFTSPRRNEAKGGCVSSTGGQDYRPNVIRTRHSNI